MTQDGHTSGRLHGLTNRARRVMSRRSSERELQGISDGDGRPVHGEPDEHTEHDHLSFDALRQELHAAVDAVMDRYVEQPMDRGALKHELDAATHQIVDEHVSGSSLVKLPVDEAQKRWEDLGAPIVAAAGTSVAAATARLQEALQAAYGQSKPGVARTVKLAPKVVPIVARALGAYANDPQKLAQLQAAAEALLVRQFHIKSGTARALVEIAVRVVQTSPRPGKGGGPEEPRNPS